MPCRRSRYSVRTSSQLRKRIRNSGTIVKIQIATTALAIASARNICGLLQPSPRCRARPASAASTMKPEFWMFSAANTRAICEACVRLWINANSGTTKMPVNRPIPSRSTMRRTLPGWRRNCARSNPPTGARPGRAKYRSSRNALMPNAPTGTRPISTVRPDSFSHSSEPTPVPMENSASANTYSVAESAGPPR